MCVGSSYTHTPTHRLIHTYTHGAPLASQKKGFQRISSAWRVVKGTILALPAFTAQRANPVCVCVYMNMYIHNLTNSLSLSLSLTHTHIHKPVRLVPRELSHSSLYAFSKPETASSAPPGIHATLRPCSVCVCVWCVCVCGEVCDV
jgi:hypothetical protein